MVIGQAEYPVEMNSRIANIYEPCFSEKMMHYKRNIIDVLLDIALC